VEIIRIGAKMHDIGKIGVPDAVLQKQGPLTMEEYDLIKLHPQIGKRILERVGQFQRYLPIIELHHEDWDGRGYPYAMMGEEIPLGARIVHVADVYDAITSDRAYRKAMPADQVREIMQRGSGTMFEPKLVEVFLAILRERQLLESILSEANLIPSSEAQPART
jgi:HD-GYP domain-containing protein (c-di-GMP phosphodiesterase class II)